MKKAIILFCLSVSMLSVNAQEAFSEVQTQKHVVSPSGILGVAFGSTKGETISILRNRNDVAFGTVFPDTWSFGYSGSFLGKPTAGIELFFENNKFYRASIGYPYISGSMLKEYSEIKNALISLYGNPDYEKNYISSAFQSGQEEKAVNANRAAINVGWVFDNSVIIHMYCVPEYVTLIFYSKDLYSEMVGAN